MLKDLLEKIVDKLEDESCCGCDDGRKKVLYEVDDLKKEIECVKGKLEGLKQAIEYNTDICAEYGSRLKEKLKERSDLENKLARLEAALS